MWFLFRPDAANVWKNSRVRECYRRYKGIIDGIYLPRYLLTKKIPADFSPDKPLDKLWSIHDEIAQDFPSFVKEIDAGEKKYQELSTPSSSFLDLKTTIVNRMLESCHFCERRCAVDRSVEELGFCRVGSKSRIASAFLHQGEESVLVPSGTIFFTGCTFTCVFCQNYDISQEWMVDTKPSTASGTIISPEQLAKMMRSLRQKGAKNINFVGGDPTPNLHTIVRSLSSFNDKITLLWNSNMYQSLEATKILLELMDFWLPDFKFWDNKFAQRMSGITNYHEIITRNILKAYSEGSGEVLIRHLIMPNRLEEDTYPILEWCASKTPNAMVNLMDQYHPDYLIAQHPRDYPQLNRRISSSEWQKAKNKADSLGIFWEPVS